MSAFWSTVIGAAAAIVGGFGAAMWQTSRADKVALRIRRAERREEGLLELHAKLTTVFAAMIQVAGTTESEPDVAWTSTQGWLKELRTMWESRSSGLIPDQSIIDAYNAFYLAAHECVPDGPLGETRRRELQTGGPEAERRFASDLRRVVPLIGALDDAVYRQVHGLLRP